MKLMTRMLRVLGMVGWLALTNSIPAQTGAQPAPAKPAPASEMLVDIMNFQGMPIQAALEYYEKLTNRSLIQAPSITGTVYFRSQSKLTIDEAKAALETVFSINNIAVIPMGEKFLKVVPLATAKQEGIPFGGEGKTQPASDVAMTQVIPLKFADAADIATALQPYMHSWGQLLQLPKSGCILLTETAANVNQMLEIVKYIDVPSALRMETHVLTLKHAKAGDVVQRLQGIIQETQQLGARAAAPTAPTTPQPPNLPNRIPQPTRPSTTSGGGAEDTVIEGKVILTADERTNKIFILSRASNFAFFEKMISELDSKVDPDVIMKVVSLDYAAAEDAASLVNALITGGSVSTSSRRTSNSGSTTGSSSRTSTPASVPPPPISTTAGGGSGTDTGFLQFAQGVRILPDARTNALLIMATKEDMQRIEALIKSVDTPVAQVLIEVVIAEVTLNNELDIGVDVFKRLFNSNLPNNGAVTQTGGSSTGTGAQPPMNLTSVLASNIPTAASLASGPAGLTYFATFQNLKLDAVIHALSTTSKAKVLSTPVIQTLDNQEASILVGSSVPVPVSTVSSVVSGSGTLSSGSLNANIEYKDVAIELKVTPRINPGGYVRMDIEQKVNDLGPANNISGTTVPTIEKREAKSSVAVQDHSTIALGGLIKETKSVTQTKVPFLGDIPFLGQLFKSQTNNKTRTELIIFIRPTVMRTDAAAAAEARRRSRLLKAADELELDRHFGAAFDPTNSRPVQPVSATPTNVPAADNEETRRNAKLKALADQTNSKGN